jgi:hypothetical protein
VGSLMRPWRTVQHAADSVSPGATVMVRGGTYNEAVTLTASGLVSAPITFSAFPGETVTLSGAASDPHEWAAFTVSQGIRYVNLTGFRLRDYRQTGVDMQGSNSNITLARLDSAGAESSVRVTWGYSGEAPLYGPADHIIIRDSRFHDNHLGGFDCTPGPCDGLLLERVQADHNGVGTESFGADGIAIERGSDVVVQDCYVHDNGGDGIDINSRDWDGTAHGVVVQRNRVANNHKNGIKVWSGGLIVSNALWGQGLAPLSLGAYTSTLSMVNNSVAYNMYDASFAVRDYAMAVGYPDESGYSAPFTLTLVNNLFALNTDPAVGSPTGIYLGPTVRLTEHHNLYYSREDGEIQAAFTTQEWYSRDDITSGQWLTDTGQGMGDIVGDPRLISEANLHLRLGSAANNAADPLLAPPLDLERHPRRGRPDIGAYELGEWTATQVFLAPALWLRALGTSSGAGGWVSDVQYPRTLGDVNGDGRQDAVGFGSSGAWVALSDGSRFAPPAIWSTSYGTSARSGGWSSQDVYPRQLADVNGDGMADIVGLGQHAAWVSLSTGSRFDTPTVWLSRTMDAADGWSRQSLAPRALGDVTGDGKADLVGFGPHAVMVAPSSGTAFISPTVWLTATFGSASGAGGWSSQDVFPRFVADVDGDGRADLIGVGQMGVYVALSTGGGFLPPTMWLRNLSPGVGGWLRQGLYPRLVGDVNGDGRADIVACGQSGVYVSFSTGSSFAAPVRDINAWGAGAGGWTDQTVYPRLLGDVTGDHQADLVGFGSAGVYVSVSVAP